MRKGYWKSRPELHEKTIDEFSHHLKSAIEHINKAIDCGVINAKEIDKLINLQTKIGVIEGNVYFE